MQTLPSNNPASVIGAQDGRKFRRFEFDVRLRATVRKNSGRVAVQGRGNDLSGCGLAAFLPVDLAEGESIELDVTLPYATQPLKLRAVVRNRRGYLYGLEFANTTPAQRAVIARCCGALELTQ